MCLGKKGDMEICSVCLPKERTVLLKLLMGYYIYEIFAISSITFNLHLPKDLAKVKEHRVNKIAPDSFLFQGCE